MFDFDMLKGTSSIEEEEEEEANPELKEWENCNRRRKPVKWPLLC